MRHVLRLVFVLVSDSPRGRRVARPTHLRGASPGGAFGRTQRLPTYFTDRGGRPRGRAGRSPRFPPPERAEVTRPGRGVRVALALGLVGLALVGLLFRALPAVAPDRQLAVPRRRPTPTPAAAEGTTPAPSATAPAAASATRAAAAKTAEAVGGESEGRGAGEGRGKKPRPENRSWCRGPAPGRTTRRRPTPPPASSAGTLKRYDVRVEHGLDIDPEEAAESIEKVLNDKRSWRGVGQLALRAGPARRDAPTCTPTSPRRARPTSSARRCCTRGEVSCQNGNKVVLNAKRWLLRRVLLRG